MDETDIQDFTVFGSKSGLKKINRYAAALREIIRLLKKIRQGPTQIILNSDSQAIMFEMWGEIIATAEDMSGNSGTGIVINNDQGITNV